MFAVKIMRNFSDKTFKTLNVYTSLYIISIANKKKTQLMYEFLEALYNNQMKPLKIIYSQKSNKR